MATKIRLQRFGRKGYAFYHIVVADSRAPRDGKFIERLGSYNPNTNPAIIDLNFDRALYWVKTGAQPTDTMRNLLSEEGVMMKKHLDGGVKKGAFDEAEALKRFNAWKENKDSKLNATKETLANKKEADLAARLEAEKAVNAAREEAFAKKLADENAAKIEAEKAAQAAADAEKAAKEAPVEAPEAPVAE